MTTQFTGCQMTAKDVQICSGVLKTLAGTGSTLARLLKEKIDTAIIVPDEQINPLVVTLNSRVDFIVDGGAAETRIIVQNEFRHGLVGLTLPITTARGLALLGLWQGQSHSFKEHGQTRSLLVRRVLYQPEARRFARDAVRRQGPPAKIIDFPDRRNARLVEWGGRPSASPFSESGVPQ